MAHAPMTLSDFSDALDRLGCEVDTWPDDLRQSARLLIQTSTAARETLDQATALRQALTPSPISAPPGLSDRIITAALSGNPPKSKV